MGHVQRSGLFAEICRLHRSGMGKRKIAKTLGVGKNNTVEIALKAAEGEALDIVGALAKKGRVLHVEIRGASLEDIFVELTKKD